MNEPSAAPTDPIPYGLDHHPGHPPQPRGPTAAPKPRTRVDELTDRVAAQLRTILAGRAFRFEFDRVDGEPAIDRLARVVLDGSFVLEHSASGRVDLERRGPLQPRSGSYVAEWRTRHEIEDAPPAWRLRVLGEASELLEAALLFAQRTAGEGPDVDAVLDEAEATLALLEHADAENEA